MVYANIQDDGRVDLCSGSIRNVNIYKDVSEAYLKAKVRERERGRMDVYLTVFFDVVSKWVVKHIKISNTLNTSSTIITQV